MSANVRRQNVQKELKGVNLHVSREDDHAVVVRVEFTVASAKEWSLYLCMLAHELVETISLSDQPGVFTLQISTAHRKRHVKGKHNLVEWERNSAYLTISRFELESWLVFFLEFVRDGLASVNHIDVQASPSKGTGRELFLVLSVYPSQDHLRFLGTSPRLES